MDKNRIITLLVGIAAIGGVIAYVLTIGGGAQEPEATATPKPVVTIGVGGTPVPTETGDPDAETDPDTGPDQAEDPDAQPEDEPSTDPEGEVVVPEIPEVVECDKFEGCDDEAGQYQDGDFEREPKLRKATEKFVKAWFTVDLEEPEKDRAARLKKAGAAGPVLTQPSVFQRTDTVHAKLTGTATTKGAQFTAGMGRVGEFFSIFANVPVSAQYRLADGTGNDVATTGSIQVWFDEKDRIVKVKENFPTVKNLK